MDNEVDAYEQMKGKVNTSSSSTSGRSSSTASTTSIVFHQLVEVEIIEIVDLMVGSS